MCRYMDRDSYLSLNMVSMYQKTNKYYYKIILLLLTTQYMIWIEEYDNFLSVSHLLGSRKIWAIICCHIFFAIINLPILKLKTITNRIIIFKTCLFALCFTYSRVRPKMFIRKLMIFYIIKYITNSLWRWRLASCIILSSQII